MVRYDKFHLIFEMQLTLFQDCFLNQGFRIHVGRFTKAFKLGFALGMLFRELPKFRILDQ